MGIYKDPALEATFFLAGLEAAYYCNVCSNYVMLPMP
jgi:hypothetical protein